MARRMTDPPGEQPPIQTGQTFCCEETGRDVACDGSGQDAEFRRGSLWPEPRFEPSGEIVLDRLTGLTWARDASLVELPTSFSEALAFVGRMNREGALGRSDWRLPNRRELRSLVSHAVVKPALPSGHPFLNVVETWYWSSTTAAVNTRHAWYVHMAGARMFYGAKDQSYFVWPVSGAGNGLLPNTGQRRCFDDLGRIAPCRETGQDAEIRSGRPWPTLRFEAQGEAVRDRLTGLVWRRSAALSRDPATWSEALAQVEALNRTAADRAWRWRLPNINELETLVDCDACRPALPAGHPFEDVKDGYWSSTTSAFERDWAFALYLDKGAVGVGQKRGRHFHAWAVR